MTRNLPESDSSNGEQTEEQPADPSEKAEKHDATTDVVGIAGLVAVAIWAGADPTTVVFAIGTLAGVRHWQRNQPNVRP